MPFNATQRFITGLPVYDTYSGLQGTIVVMNLDVSAVPPLAPTFTGSYFIVEFSNTMRQSFTTGGKRVSHVDGSVLAGTTLLTAGEYSALLAAGYPST